MKIQEEVIQILANLLAAQGEIPNVEKALQELSPNTDLSMHFLLDSLDMSEIFLLIQEKFNIKIPQDDYMDLNTVGEIESYIKMKLQAVNL